MNISKSPRTMAIMPVVLGIYKHAALNNLSCPTFEDMIRDTECTEHEVNSATIHLIREGKITVEKIAARRRIYVKSINTWTDWTAQRKRQEIRKSRKCLVCADNFMSLGRGNRICSRCKSLDGHGMWGAQWE